MKYLFSLNALIFAFLFVLCSCTGDDYISVSGISITPATLSIHKGHNATLVATVSPTDATNKNVHWSTSDNNVVLVDTHGNITAIKAGSAIVTATTEDGNYFATTTIAVVVDVDKIVLSESSIYLFEGETTYLKFTILPSDATDVDFVYQSSDESIVSVSQDGNIIAKSVGVANVTVKTTNNNIAADCEVIVRRPAINGHEYVDLGLPSGTLWSTCNLGASLPGDYGYYIAWGEKEPKTVYNWNSYKYCNGTKTSLTKYNTDSLYGNVDNLVRLEPSDDAATIHWGERWCMPTKEQWQELVTYCDWNLSTEISSGNIRHNGYKIAGKNGKYIFIPCAGETHWMEGVLANVGYSFVYWSSDLNTNNPQEAWFYYIDTATSTSRFNGGRYYGHSIRPVVKDNK